MLRGLECPDTGQRWTRAEALSEALEKGTCCGLPPEVLLLAFDRHARRHPGAWDVATGALRRVVLEEIVPYYVNPRQLYPLVRGSLIHLGTEGIWYPEGTRVFREYKTTNFPIACRIDLYFPDSGLLVERKTTGGKLEDLPPAHVVQANIYALALEAEGLPVSRILLYYYGWWQIQVREAPRLPTDELHYMIEQSIAVLNRAFGERRVPPREWCNKDSCRYCAVRQLCRSLPEGWASWNDIERQGITLEGDIRWQVS